MHLPRLTRKKTFFAIIILVISITAQFTLPTPKSNTSYAKVTYVFDGDTIQIASGQHIRYIGMDTPELYHGQKPDQCYAKEAYIENKELVYGKIVRLVSDTTNTDKYGRLLRYVYAGDQFVNDFLVKKGYARTMSIRPDTKYASLFKVSQQEAQTDHLGLWGKCPTP